MAEPKRAVERSLDAELARRCTAGDRAAQVQVFEEQRGQVHRTLFRIMGSNREMEDLAQDTFVEVFRSIGTFRGDASLRTWVDSVAARVAFRHLTRRGPRTQHLEAVPEIESGGAGPEQVAQAREAVRRLYRVLDRLDPKYRIAYALHHVDGRPLSEVARVTRVSLVAAKNRASRARRMVNDRAKKDPVLSEFLKQAEATR